MYNICVRNAGNQSAFVALGGLSKLAAMLRRHLHNLTLVEKVLTALLCIVLKHPENQKLLVRNLGNVFGVPMLAN